MSRISPKIAESAFIAPGARILGRANIGESASVWYNAVIRADVAEIIIGDRSNVQDNCTLHCDPELPLVIGKDVTIGHNAVLHSCTVGDGSLIGMGAVVLSGAKIGEGCLIAAGAVVVPCTVVPDGALFAGVPAKLKRMLSEAEKADIRGNAGEYLTLSAKYKAGEF